MKPSSSPKYSPERSMKRNSDSPQRKKTWCVAMGEAWDGVASPRDGAAMALLPARLVDEALVLGQLLYETVLEVKHVLDVLLVRVRVRGWG